MTRVVGRRAAVHIEGGKLNAGIGVHGVENIGRLEAVLSLGIDIRQNQRPGSLGVLH